MDDGHKITTDLSNRHRNLFVRRFSSTTSARQGEENLMLGPIDMRSQSPIRFYVAEE